MEYISLICPVLNEEKSISRFLDYILNQTYVPEVVFVDGGSFDNTIKIIKEYQKKSNKIKLVQLNERGTGKAINIGASYATGLYLVHVGADFSFISKNFFSKALNAIKTNNYPNILKVSLPLKPRFNNILKDSFMLFDSRHDLFLSIPFIKKEIFPTFPKIAYGEDKIAAKKIANHLKNAKVVKLDEDFLRFKESFSIHDFIKRYLWYGRTFKYYLKISKDIKEYFRISISVLSVFFPPLLIFPLFLGIYESIKFVRIFPPVLIFFPIFSCAAVWLMGIGFLIGFFNSDLGH
jgi:glycosyltransferase involved in cell wall biosynthesis